MSKLSALSLIGLLACLTYATAAAAATISTEEQAIERAKQFFTDVGWKADAQPGAQFPDEKPREYCWVVRLYCSDRKQTSYEANIDRATGQIHGAFLHESYSEPSNKKTKISKSGAQALALGYLRAAGLPLGNSCFERINTVNGCDAHYRRMYRCYPFRLDGIIVQMNPSDGRLRGLGYHCASAVPEGTRVVVSRDRAISIAKEYLSEWTDEPGTLSSAKLMIVQPNDYYEGLDVHEMLEPRNTSCLAWVMDFVPPRSHAAEVWVDSDSGAVLGGVACMCGISLRCVPAVDKATAGTVCPAGGPAVREGSPLAEADRLGMVDFLKHTRWRHRNGLATASHAAFLELRDASRSYRFGYSPKEHRLDLLEKEYAGGTVKAKLSWDTSKEVEDLLANYMGPQLP